MSLRLIFCLLVTSMSYPQNKGFDSLFQHTTKVVLTSTPQEVFKHITALERQATTPIQRIEVSIFKASLLRQYGVRDQAITTLKEADSLATKIHNATLQARIHGALSTLYRENGIESLGKLSLVKAQHWSKSIKDPLELAILKGNLQQEQAYYHLGEKRFEAAISTLNLGRIEFEKIDNPQRRSFFYASTDQLIGETYIEMGEWALAIQSLEQALGELEISDNPNSPLKGFIYNNLGMTYLQNQNYERSISYLNKAQDVAEKSDFSTLKKLVFASLKIYAKQLGDMQKYSYYNERYLYLVEQELNVQAKIANYLVEIYYEKEGELTLAYKNYVLYSLSIGGGVLLFLSFSFYYRRKQVKVSGVEEVLSPAVMEKKEVTEQSNEELVIDYNYISREMEELVLKGIHNFEMQRGFLKHEISLSKLASQIGVNHRYLSYVIKHHKHQDFSSYINTLRIDYIIALLEANPEMLKYKISYLADLCGFASHSRFTITFKRIKGISPSAFIEQIKEKL